MMLDMALRQHSEPLLPEMSIEALLMVISYPLYVMDSLQKSTHLATCVHRMIKHFHIYQMW